MVETLPPIPKQPLDLDVNVNKNVVATTKSKSDAYPSDDDNTAGKSKPGIRWRQCYAAFAANLGAFSFGTVWAWTATALPSLKEEGTLGDISSEEEAWITSILFIGALVSSPMTGYLLERYGRRAAFFFVTPPMVLGWLLIAFAQNVPMIYAGRFLTGTCAGCFGVLAPVYVAEISEKDIRGMLMCGFEPSMAAGMVFMYLVGTYTPWNIQAVVSAIPPIASHILLLFAAESPRYLLANERIDEAKVSLSWFRTHRTSDEIKAELKEMSINTEENADIFSSNTSKMRNLLRMDVLKPILIGMGLFFFHQASGNYGILAYTVDIFRSAGSTDAYWSTTIVGIAQMLGAFIPIFLVEITGRRFLLLLSEAMAGLTLVVLGLFFYLKSYYGDEYVQANLSWLPLTTLVIHEVAFATGMGPIPFLLLGELAPPTAKGISTTLMTSTVRLMGFIVLYSFNNLLSGLGMAGGYWFLALMCLFGTVFIYFCVPETKGRTLEEIHSSFLKNNKLSLNNYNNINI